MHNFSKIPRSVLPLTVLFLAIAQPSPCLAAQRCQVFYGRIVFYPGDGQLRLWHIGTHHEFEPDDIGGDQGQSWNKAVDLLKAGNETAGAAGDNALFADFVVCPTEPLRKGWVQPAVIRGMSHVHVVPRS